MSLLELNQPEVSRVILEVALQFQIMRKSFHNRLILTAVVCQTQFGCIFPWKNLYWRLIWVQMHFLFMVTPVEYSETGHFADDGKQASGCAWIKLSTFNGRKCRTNIQGAPPWLPAPPGAQPCGLGDYLWKKGPISLKQSFSPHWPRWKRHFRSRS